MNNLRFVFLFFLLIIAGCNDNTGSQRERTQPLPEDSGPMDFNDQPETLPEEIKFIEVDEPEADEIVRSPLHVKGRARGPWFFEAQAGYELVDAEGNILAEGAVSAEGEWMTEDFVPFSADITFEAPEVKEGFLILKKANPSGKPENDLSLKIPVVFRD